MLAVFQQARQQGVEFGKRVRRVHPQGGRCSLGAQAVAVPDFTLQVFGRAKQRAVAFRGEHQQRLRFGKAAEVVEVAVSAKGKAVVAVARLLDGGGDEGDGARAELRGQARAALGMDGVHARHRTAGGGVRCTPAPGRP